MSEILLITPPFVQPNTPYPATAYLKGYLAGEGVDVGHYDLSIGLLGEIFSAGFLGLLFATAPGNDAGENITRIYNLRRRYIATIGPVIDFLRGNDLSLAQLICSPDFLPQGGRFSGIEEQMEHFGRMGTCDCARFLATLYLHEIGDYIRHAVTEHFELARYGERLSLAVAEFSRIEAEVIREANIIEDRMTALLDEVLERERPRLVGFTIPFPGNLIAALRCARHIKEHHDGVGVIFGGGYPSTELRGMTDRGIFRYVDYIVLDDGERALKEIVEGRIPAGVITPDGAVPGGQRITHLQRGCPDFGGLRHGEYLSLCETTNPMLRLWSDGAWNKMYIAHGCYWGRCAFCDTSLDYIGRYDTVPAATFVDWMEMVARQRGSRGFHFVDEAAPPKMLKEISLEILRRGLTFTWWTNIRFEKAFTGDLCALMASAGCIAVSGGLETASNRLLELMGKGISVEEATVVMRNFFYAGIMVHGYLMYGFPTQTLQESVDALEVVRQIFRAELLDSAFWHRYAMTVHSPSGTDPEAYGVRRRPTHPNPFANNEVYYAENRGYDIHAAGSALRAALEAYMAGDGLDRPAHKWFQGKAPQTTVEEWLVTDQLIKPDASRIFDARSRLVWLSAPPRAGEGGIVVDSPSRRKEFAFAPHDTAFLTELLGRCSDLDTVTTLDEARELYASYSPEPFLTLYHSKKWDALRGFGLLQV